MADVSKVKLNGTAYNVKDASVPSWAKQSSKPSYTQDEVGDGSTYKRVTSAEKNTWNNKGTYSKPSGGIPKTDLASAVQTSLGKADSALQSFTETDPTVPSWAKQSSKPSYTYSEVGAAPTNHDHGRITTTGDNRSVPTIPNDYPHIIQFNGLKQNSVINNPSSDTYSYLVGLRGWSDDSGGHAHEFAFNDTGIFTRKGATTTWDSWSKLAMTSDIPSSLPASDVYSWAKQSSKPSYTQDEVSDGNTYKRVTSAEKSYLAQLVDNSFKNFLRFTFEGATSANGITVTRNADGTLTANGTAGSGNSYIILSQNLTLPAGTYAISAVNAYTSNCYIYDNGSWESVYGRQERTFDGSTPVTILLRVAAGTTLSNVVIKPMICRIEAWRVSTAFAPYRSDYNSIGKFIDGVDISGTDAVYSADLDSIDRTITRIYYNPSNAPYGLYGFMLVKTLYTDTNTVFQEVTAVNNQTGTMFDSVRPKFIRTKTGGSWDPWIEMSENNRFLIDDGSYEASSKTFNTTYLKYKRMYLISISRFYSSTSGSGVAMYAFNNQPDIPLVTTITEKSDCKASISVSNGVLTINYSASGYYVTSISLL